MKENYSIVVVGAGPAGCNFARRVDSRKYDILLLDGAGQRGEKVCAGLLSPDAQDLLAEYDICIPNEILVSPQLFSVRTIDLAGEKMRHYRRNYMNVDRAKFDRFLLDMIPQYGFVSAKGLLLFITFYTNFIVLSHFLCEYYEKMKIQNFSH